jgi:hypothetical protein
MGAFAKGRSFVILNRMSEKLPEAEKLLNDLKSISQQEFEQRFGQLLKTNPSYNSESGGSKDNKTEKTTIPRDKKIELSKQNVKKFTPRVEEIIKGYSEIEPQVTNLLKNLSTKYKGNMELLEFRMKTKESMLNKIERDFVEKTKDFKEFPGKFKTEPTRESVLEEIRDVLRYTSKATTENLTNHILGMVKELEAQGFKRISCKNNFLPRFEGERQEVKNVNMKFQDKSGKVFELQYHSDKTFPLINDAHKLYEIKRLINDVNAPEYKNATNQLVSIFESVPTPPNAEQICK